MPEIQIKEEEPSAEGDGAEGDKQAFEAAQTSASSQAAVETGVAAENKQGGEVEGESAVKDSVPPADAPPSATAVKDEADAAASAAPESTTESASEQPSTSTLAPAAAAAGPQNTSTSSTLIDSSGWNPFSSSIPQPSANRIVLSYSIPGAGSARRLDVDASVVEEVRVDRAKSRVEIDVLVKMPKRKQALKNK